MLLITVAALAALGIAVFAGGMVLDRPELAMFGAIIVIGVGGSAMATGVQVQDGQVVDDVTKRVALDDVSLSEFSQERDVSGRDTDPTGVAFNDTGSRMYVSGASNAEVYQYDAADWGVSSAAYERGLSVAAEDNEPTGLAVAGQGRFLYVSGDETDRVYQYEMSDPYNVSTAGVLRFIDVSSFTTTPRAVEFADQGSLMYLVDGSDSEIEQFSLNDPYNISSASQEAAVDTSAQTSAPTGVAFGKNGSRMLLSGGTDDVVYQYSLTSDYEASTASFTGSTLNTSADVDGLAGLEYEDNGRLVIVPGQRSSSLAAYDSARNDTREVTRNTYRDVSTVSSFPLDVVILLLGAVMLIGGSGEASEADTGEGRR